MISQWAYLKGVRAREQTFFKEGRSTLDHIMTLLILIEQEASVGQCLYSCFVDFKKTIDTIPFDKLRAHLQRLGVPPYLQHVVKAIYTAVYAKV